MPRHSPYALYSLNSFVLVLYKLLFAIYCLSFVSIISILDCFSRLWKSYAFFYLEFFHLDIVSLTCKAYFVLANCSYPRFLERPFCYWLKLIFILKTVFLNYLFVLLYLLYSVFNEHLHAKHFCVFCWWAQMDSNHRPRAYQARALATWAMSPCSWLR